jgi:hypothetical protein
MADSASSVPGRIFISYRREETAYPAGWLFERLRAGFGGQVFKDVDSIELGDDFVDKITAAVASCDVLLALIGDEWLTITDENGRRRIDDPGDFVRLEIEAALTRKVRVIPVLVDGAKMPRADELPPALAGLARRQALELNPSRFDSDTSRLEKALEKTLAEVQAPRPPSGTEPAAATQSSTPRPRESPGQREQARVSRTGGDLPTATAPSAEPITRAGWLRRHPVLTTSAVVIALAGLTAVILAGSDDQGEESSGGGGAGGAVVESSSGGSAALPQEIPAAIKKSCQRATGDDAWMVGGWGATEQWTCQAAADLNYAVFSSAGEAGGSLDDVYHYTLLADAEPGDRAKQCDKATEAQITAAKGQWNGTTRCTVGVTPGQNEGDLSIYWNDRGSPLVGLRTVGSDTKPHDAVNDWAKLISTD